MTFSDNKYYCNCHDSTPWSSGLWQVILIITNLDINIFGKSVCLQEAIAEEQRMAARYSNDISIAKSQRDFEIKKAIYDQEVQTKKAESDLAYSLQVGRLLTLRQNHYLCINY